MSTARPQGMPQLERTISLWGALALVVGAVLGAGIYALIAPIAASTGNTIWLAFAIAMLVSLVGVIPVIQLAGAMPRAGAGYFFASRLLGAEAGVVTAVWILLAGAFSTCVVSLALAEYLLEYVPLGVSPHWVACAILLAFYSMYYMGMRFAIGLQGVMVLQLVVALAVYGMAGVVHDVPRFGLTPPQGWGAFGMAVLLCYNTCLGFQVLAELGEEIRHARRTIPLALIIGGAIVGVLYVIVAAVFVTSVPYDAALYDELRAPLDYSARLFLSPGLAMFVSLGALTAGLTSLNAAAVALPRELFAVSRDDILPRWFSAIDRRTHVPMRAVTAFFVIAVALMACHLDLETYGLGAAVGIQITTGIIGIASLRLKRLYPAEHAAAYIRFPKGVLWFCAVFTALASAVFAVLIAVEQPGVVAAFAVTGFVGVAYCLWRGRQLSAAGLPWRSDLRKIPGPADL